MPNSTSIRILEKDNNRRGDLFGRLMADLFVALGYEQPRLNVHKSGRELDLSADHRLEKRRALAECKATADPIGGADVNKFVSSLDRELKKRLHYHGLFHAEKRSHRMNNSTTLSNEPTELLSQGWIVLVEHLGLPQATQLVVLLELVKGNSVLEIKDYWGNADIDEIHARVMQWQEQHA